MKAIGVHPGRPNSIQLPEIAGPNVTDIPDGRGVEIEVLRVGLDGTDKGIHAMATAADRLRRRPRV